jgi:hypothetical protein
VPVVDKGSLRIPNAPALAEVRRSDLDIKRKFTQPSVSDYNVTSLVMRRPHDVGNQVQLLQSVEATLKFAPVGGQKSICRAWSDFCPSTR